MNKHTLLSGEVVDLRGLNRQERAFLADLKAKAKTEQDDYFDLLRSVKGPEALPLRGSMITPQIARSPFYRVAHDIVDRVGIEQGCLLNPGAVFAPPPPGEWLSMTQAAGLIGVSRPAVHKALLARRLKGLQIGNAWIVELRRAIEYKQRREPATTVDQDARRKLEGLDSLRILRGKVKARELGPAWRDQRDARRFPRAEIKDQEAA